jgi:hypothetical protein
VGNGPEKFFKFDKDGNSDGRIPRLILNAPFELVGVAGVTLDKIVFITETIRGVELTTHGTATTYYHLTIYSAIALLYYTIPPREGDY